MKYAKTANGTNKTPNANSKYLTIKSRMVMNKIITQKIMKRSSKPKLAMLSAVSLKKLDVIKDRIEDVKDAPNSKASSYK